MTVNGTFAAGLLTATYAAADLATQDDVALSAGTFRLNGVVGKTASGASVRVKITGDTDGVVLDKVYDNAPISADNTLTRELNESTDSFTLTVAQDVDVSLGIVAAGTTTPATGSGTIQFILESA